MSYEVPPVSHTDIFDNFIDTQQTDGLSSASGALPSRLLIDKFEETPMYEDPFAFHDYARGTIVDRRPDVPTMESEESADTTKWSKTRMNLRLYGSKSGADPPNHAELNLSSIGEDTRGTSGDFRQWQLAAEMAKRHAYWTPTAPRAGDGTVPDNFVEMTPDGAPENAPYRRLNEARRRVKDLTHTMFSRSLAQGNRGLGMASAAGVRQLLDQQGPDNREESSNTTGCKINACARESALMRADDSDLLSRGHAIYTPHEGCAARIGQSAPMIHKTINQMRGSIDSSDIVRGILADVSGSTRGAGLGTSFAAREQRMLKHASFSDRPDAADFSYRRASSLGNATLMSLASAMSRVGSQAGSSDMDAVDSAINTKWNRAQTASPAHRAMRDLNMAMRNGADRHVVAEIINSRASARGAVGTVQAGSNLGKMESDIDKEYVVADAMLMIAGAHGLSKGSRAVANDIQRLMVVDSNAPAEEIITAQKAARGISDMIRSTASHVMAETDADIDLNIGTADAWYLTKGVVPARGGSWAATGRKLQGTGEENRPKAGPDFVDRSNAKGVGNSAKPRASARALRAPAYEGHVESLDRIIDDGQNRTGTLGAHGRLGKRGTNTRIDVRTESMVEDGIAS